VTSVIKPAVWIVYVVIVFEILFMISPFAIHFYATYGPALNFLHRWPETAWVTKFYLPHFTETTNPVLNAVHPVGLLLIVGGLSIFFAGAIPIYWAKFRRGGPVTGGLYDVIRHPQYVGLAITGVGTALMWPRFLVLITLVVTIFLYTLLAEWEERQCVAQFGEGYRHYQSHTGRFIPKRITDLLPRIVPASGAPHAIALVLLFVLAIPSAVTLGVHLRDWSLTRIAALYEEDTAVISTAYLGHDELQNVYRTALSDSRVEGLLKKTPGSRFIVYVVPSEWFLPDLPLDEVNPPGGHHVPSDFDRSRYKVLFTRARFHGDAVSGADIVKAAYGRDAVVVAHVDLGDGGVTRVVTPPSHVKWGDIPTPMF
jgi:protein-S-isoprenylcysteine O-methyltransferase Ste14